MKVKNKETHECPLRKKIIDDGECFETVMAVLDMHSKGKNKKIYDEYPECKKNM